MYRSRFF